MIDKAVRKDIIEYRKEIKELKEEIQRQSKALCINDELLVDYKQRIDKANEYIKRELKEFYDKNKNCKYLTTILELESIEEILGGDE